MIELHDALCSQERRHHEDGDENHQEARFLAQLSWTFLNLTIEKLRVDKTFKQRRHS